jgi:hypothetical protein
LSSAFDTLVKAVECKILPEDAPSYRSEALRRDLEELTGAVLRELSDYFRENAQRLRSYAEQGYDNPDTRASMRGEVWEAAAHEVEAFIRNGCRPEQYRRGVDSGGVTG